MMEEYSYLCLLLYLVVKCKWNQKSRNKSGIDTGEAFKNESGKKVNTK